MTRLKMNDYDRYWRNSDRTWRYMHRDVVEQAVGRSLKSNEHVHHINGNHRDNRLENLCVVTPAEHVRIHKPAKKNRRCSVERCHKKHHANGLCKMHQMRQLRTAGKCS